MLWPRLKTPPLFPGEMKAFTSTLEVRGRKERAQSLSNIDILISHCGPDHRTPPADPAFPQFKTNEPVEKICLEAAASFPLGRSKIVPCSSSPTLSSSLFSHRKSISNIVYSPAHQDQGGVEGVRPLQSQQTSPGMSDWGVHYCPTGAETKQEVKASTPVQPDGEQQDETVGSHQGNREEEELQEGTDEMYPTLRSKSLNTNPRKTKRKESGEARRSTGSVKDLVSAFGGVTGGLQSRTRSRDSD